MKRFTRTTTYLLPTVLLLVVCFLPEEVEAARAITKVVESFFWGIFIAIGGLFLWLGGILLDYAIMELVIQMGDTLTKNVGVAVDQLWVIIRDVFNILFIFALVYIGLRTILDSDGGGTRKLLGNLIIAALLINFSLLITKMVIDFANIAATQIYDQISINANYGIQGNMLQGKSISGAVFDVMGLSTFDDGSIAKEISDNAEIISFQVIVFGFLTMLLMIIMGFVFATGALILVKRFIMLIIFMIFSPAMFLGLILPNFKKYQDLWWGEFLKNAFIAPAFLFMLFLSLTVLRAMQPQGSFAQAYRAKSSEDGNFDIFLFFFVAAGFIIASMMVAERMGSSAAGATLKGLRSAGNTMRGAAQGFAYRNTAGRGLAGAVQGIDWFEKKMAKSEKKDGERTWLSRNARRTGRSIARTAITDEAIRRSIEKGANFDAGGRGRATVQADEKARIKRASGLQDTDDLRSAIAAYNDTAEGSPERADAAIKLEAVMAKADKASYEKIADSKNGIESLTAVAGSINQKTFEGLLESDELDSNQKGALIGARQASIRQTLTAVGKKMVDDGSGGFTEGLRKATADQIDALDFNDDIMANAMQLQSGQMDDLKKKYGPEKYRILDEAREAQIMEAGPAAAIASRRGNKEIAKLPKDMVENADFINHLVAEDKMNADLLGKIATESGANKKTVGALVLDAYGAGVNINNAPANIKKFMLGGPGVQFLPDSIKTGL